MKCLLLLTGILSCTLLGSQNFTSTVYGTSDYDDPRVVKLAPDSGFFIGGGAAYNGTQDLLLIRTNAFADTLWTLAMSTTGADFLNDICVLADGSCLITGQLDVAMFSANNFFVARVDPSGQLVWMNKYNTSNTYGLGNAIVPFIDGSGFLVAGSMGMGAQLQYESYAMKIDSAGNLLWGYHYGTNSNNEMTECAWQTPDGGFFLAGGRNNNEALLLRIDSAGTLLWSKTYGGTGIDYFADIVSHPGGGYVLTGTTFSFGTPMKFLLRINSAGDTTWSYRYGGGPVQESGRNVIPSYRGGFIACGISQSSSSAHDAWLIETDSAGGLLWSRTYGGSGWEEAYSCIPAPDSTYIVLSRDESTSLVAYNFWLFKTDLDGNASTCNEYNTPMMRLPAPFTVTGMSLNQQAFGQHSAEPVVTFRGIPTVPYCEAMNIAIPEPAQTFTAFPVPATDEIILRFAFPLQDAVLRMYDTQGNVVLEQCGISGEEIRVDCSMLAPGIYFSEVSDGGGAHYTGKIVVN